VPKQKLAFKTRVVFPTRPLKTGTNEKKVRKVADKQEGGKNKPFLAPKKEENLKKRGEGRRGV